VKVGAENRSRLIAAVVLGALALGLLVMRFTNLFSGSAPASSPVAANVEPSVQSPTSPALRGHNRNRNLSKKPTPKGQSLDPTLRYDLLKASEDTKYTGTGRNIFMAHVEIPKPVVSPVVRQQQQAQGPVQPPPPPAIELKYYGFANVANKPGEPRSIFLAHGEDVFIAREGDIVNRRYKIVHATPNSVEILDVLSNNRQSIPLTQG
jgi:hypothetical protein